MQATLALVGRMVELLGSSGGTPTPISQGPFAPSDFPIEQSGIGTEGWSDAFSAQTQNDVGAQTVVIGSQTSVYLACFDYGFNLLPGAIIVGIEVSIRLSVSGNITLYCKLRLPSGSPGTTIRSTVGPFTGSYVFHTLGGPSDDWGESLTKADVEDSDFGALIYATDDGAGALVDVDVVTVKIYYTT